LWGLFGGAVRLSKAEGRGFEPRFPFQDSTVRPLISRGGVFIPRCRIPAFARPATEIRGHCVLLIAGSSRG